MTTANKITIGRIVAVPVFLLLAYLNKPVWAFAVYVLACVSDFLDGYIARHYNQITDFGKFMDPLADKMLVLAAMLLFGGVPAVNGIVTALIVLTTVYSGVEYFIKNKDVFSDVK